MPKSAHPIVRLQINTTPDSATVLQWLCEHQKQTRAMILDRALAALVHQIREQDAMDQESDRQEKMRWLDQQKDTWANTEEAK